MYKTTLDALAELLPDIPPVQYGTPQQHLRFMVEEMRLMSDPLKESRWLGYALRMAEELGLLTNEESRELVRGDVAVPMGKEQALLLELAEARADLAIHIERQQRMVFRTDYDADLSAMRERAAYTAEGFAMDYDLIRYEMRPQGEVAEEIAAAIRALPLKDEGLTRDFRETVKKRLESDPEFAQALLNEITVLQEAVEWAALQFEDMGKGNRALLLRERVKGGQWVHCSPELLQSGISCADTPRRPCQCGLEGSHDHLIRITK